MSGIASGIGKVFTSVVSGVRHIGQAVMGVGATAFTAGAANAAAPMATGGFSGVIQNLAGGGVLGNILSGAVRQAGYGALLGGAIGAATGQGFGKGALIGGLGGAVTGGLSGLGGGKGLFAAAGLQPGGSGVIPGNTATGMVATGSTASGAGQPLQSGYAGAPAQVAATTPTSAGGGLFSFLNSEAGGGLLAGLGQGLMGYQQAQAAADESQADRQFLLDKEQRLRDSYNIDPNLLPGNTPTYQPQALPGATTASSTASAQQPTTGAKFRYEYDPSVKKIVRVPG